MLSPVRLSSVCLSVCRARACALVRRLKFSAIFLRHLVPWPSVEIHGKFYGDRYWELLRQGGLHARGVSKYSDFGPIKGYISETVQDIGGKLVLITNRKCLSLIHISEPTRPY